MGIDSVKCNDIFGLNNLLGRYINPHFVINSPHGLTQLIGYLKYHRELNGPVFFRGQNKDFFSMKPSLSREMVNFSTFKKAQEKLKSFVNNSSSKRYFIRGTNRIAYEPILQHYGISTEWLDVVDNLWTALWFASHTAYSSGKNNRYVFYEKSKFEYSYIFVMYFGEKNYPITKNQIKRMKQYGIIEEYTPEENIKEVYGLLETEKYQIIDLRYMAPSLYRRPHAQHAILVKKIAFTSYEDLDYKDSIIASIKIKTSLIHEWLGAGSLMDTSFVFPPPVIDDGYRILLEQFPQDPQGVGCINIY